MKHKAPLVRRRKAGERNAAAAHVQSWHQRRTRHSQKKYRCNISTNRASTPEVSIIITCYNQGSFLRDSITSALAQSFENREIIVIDDGSTDDSATVAAEFASDIAYIYQRNAGPSAARNTGIRRARGDLIAFLDADDWWDPSFVEELYSASRDIPSSAVVYAHQLVVGDGFSAHELRVLNGPLKGNPLDALIMWPTITCDAMLVSRSALLQAGLFDPTLRGHEDWDLHLRLAALGLPFILVDKVLAYYRQHGSGAHCNVDLMDDTLFSILNKWDGYGGARFQRRRRYAIANAIVSRATRLLQRGRIAEGIAYLAQEVSRRPALLCGSPFRFLRFVRILNDSTARRQRQTVDSVAQVLAALPTNDRWVRDELASTLYASGIVCLALTGDLVGMIKLISSSGRTLSRPGTYRSFVWWIRDWARLRI